MIKDAREYRRVGNYGKAASCWRSVFAISLKDGDEYTEVISYYKEYIIDFFRDVLGSSVSYNDIYGLTRITYLTIKRVVSKVVNSKKERYAYISYLLKALNPLFEDRRIFKISDYINRRYINNVVISDIWNIRITVLPINVVRWHIVYLNIFIYLAVSIIVILGIIAGLQYFVGSIVYTGGTGCQVTGIDVIYFVTTNMMFGFPSNMEAGCMQSKLLIVVTYIFGYVYLALLINYLYRRTGSWG